MRLTSKRIPQEVVQFQKTLRVDHSLIALINAASRLLTNIETLQHVQITSWVDSLEIVQQPAAVAYHLHQSAATGVIFFVRAKMLDQPVDAGCEQSDLDVWRTGVLVVLLEITDCFLPLFFGNCHLRVLPAIGSA